MSNLEFLISNINNINGVGSKTAKLLKKKNIIRVSDILWCLPRNFVDRSNITKIAKLKIGSIQTIIIDVKKYYFPRMRNLPNKVICEDESGNIECVFFNS